MREILFHGKRAGNGEWVEGDVLQTRYHSGHIEYQIMPQTPVSSAYPVLSETVGQFTGLTDRNGKKIFEGDIVHCVSKLDSADMVVIFECGQFRMVLAEKYHEYQTNIGYYDINCFAKEVIGNIFSNSELLEVNK